MSCSPTHEGKEAVERRPPTPYRQLGKVGSVDQYSQKVGFFFSSGGYEKLASSAKKKKKKRLMALNKKFGISSLIASLKARPSGNASPPQREEVLV